MQIADIWSSGVILYAMLYGKYPFDAKEARFARKIVTADYKLLSVRRCPEVTCAQAVQRSAASILCILHKSNSGISEQEAAMEDSARLI